MQSFRFHQWLNCDVETTDGNIGIGNAALVPSLVKKAIDKYYALMVMGDEGWELVLVNIDPETGGAQSVFK